MRNILELPNSAFLSRFRIPHSAFRISLVALSLLLFLSACRQAGLVIRPTPVKTGETLVQIRNSGTSTVEVSRDKKTPPWTTASMRNAGASKIWNLAFWGGSGPLLVSPNRKVAPDTLFKPFTLLPGEELALSAPAGSGAPSDQIYGFLHWQNPRDPALLNAAIERSQQASFPPDGTFILTPAGSEAYVQFNLSAPIGYSKVSIAWDAAPMPTQPQLWINMDGDVWRRVPLLDAQGQQLPRVDWQHPADLTTTLFGARSFWLRLVYELPKTTPADGRPVPTSLKIRRVRIDRELQGPGRLRPWRNGANRFDITLTGQPHPDLEIRLP